ncbi:hypothetical protein [Cupriavidus respiraculi]
MTMFGNLISAPTPERIAAREVQNMRLALYQAERRLLEAQMQVDYYRGLVGFLEDVATTGVENVVDKRREASHHAVPAIEENHSPQPSQPAPRVAPGLTTVPIVPSAA